MKIACERCNKIMDNKLESLNYKIIRVNSTDEFILCKECYVKLLRWLDNKENEEE